MIITVITDKKYDYNCTPECANIDSAVTLKTYSTKAAVIKSNLFFTIRSFNYKWKKSIQHCIVTLSKAKNVFFFRLESEEFFTQCFHSSLILLQQLDKLWVSAPTINELGSLRASGLHAELGQWKLLQGSCDICLRLRLLQCHSDMEARMTEPIKKIILFI